MPELAGPVGAGGQGAAQPRQKVPGQALPGLAIGAGAGAGSRAAGQSTQGQNLADDFPAGAVRVEDLGQEPEEGAPDRIDSVPAVGAFLGLGEQARRQPWVEEPVQLEQALLAERGGRAVPEGRSGRARQGKKGVFIVSSNNTGLT